jgi:hypothetical protein
MNITPSRVEPIKFKLDWKNVVEGVEFKTLASVALIINDAPAWPTPGDDTSDFDWFADEFLSHWAECWKSIVLRQTYPIAVQPERPSLLRLEAEKRWSALSDAAVEREDLQVTSFERTHNLAAAFGGVTGLLPLWVFRDRGSMIIDTQEKVWEVPFNEAVNALVNAGNAIAARLRAADPIKWARLLRAWEDRDVGDETLLLSLAIGLDRKTTDLLVQEKFLEPPRSVSEAANDDDELRIAARVAGPLPLKHIKIIIDRVRSCDYRPSPTFQDVARRAGAFVRSEELTNARPHVQGTATARWLRGLLGLALDKQVDPIRALEKYGVDVRAKQLETPTLDGIAVWGPKHGPAVLLNQDSARAKVYFKSFWRIGESFWRIGAVRVTAAHELCHLLLDTEHALSAVDVLGSRMPARMEQRAKAFAAEFLLPNDIAASTWRDGGRPFEPLEVKQILRSLCRRFGVTESVAAWQLEHGLDPQDQEAIGKVLDEVAPQR